MQELEIIPAILRNTFEKISADWEKVADYSQYIQIDITDGIFAGNKGFLDLPRLKDLPHSEKIELHMMVQSPGDFVDDIIELNPGRCVFHIEAFLGTMDLPFIYNTIGEHTSAEMGVGINPDTPVERLTEFLPLVQYVLFMGYNPGIANQPIVPEIFEKIQAFHASHPPIVLTADGHVAKETIAQYARAGISRFCANTAIFGSGNPEENMRELLALAQEATEKT